MLPTDDWPVVEAFRDHWTWRPDWTSSRPRLLWYLTFEGAPHLRAAAAASTVALRSAGADVVPPQWLHLTVTDVGFHDELDEWSVRAAREEVRRRLIGTPPLELTLGPVGVLPGAVVLPVRPAEPLHRLRDVARQATADVGIRPPADMAGDFWPHISLCYVNALSDHGRLRETVHAAEPRTLHVRCEALSQVLVTRAEGHYRWEVLDRVPLLDRDGANLQALDA